MYYLRGVFTYRDRRVVVFIDNMVWGLARCGKGVFGYAPTPSRTHTFILRDSFLTTRLNSLTTAQPPDS